MEKVRNHVIEKLADTLDLSKTDPIVVNLEKSIVNHASARVETPKRENDTQSYTIAGIKCGSNAGWKEKGVAAWDNDYFVATYKQKFLHLRENLKTNETLRDAVRAKTMKPEDLVQLKPWELQPNGRYAQQMEKQIHKELRKQALQDESKCIEGFFTCRRCKSKRTSYYELQTRAADEPTTVFVTCLNCDAHWKT